MLVNQMSVGQIVFDQETCHLTLSYQISLFWSVIILYNFFRSVIILYNFTITFLITLLQNDNNETADALLVYEHEQYFVWTNCIK